MARYGHNLARSSRIVKKERTASQSKSIAPPGGGGVLVLNRPGTACVEIVTALLAGGSQRRRVGSPRTLEEAEKPQRLVLDAKPDLFVLDVDAAYESWPGISL